MVDFERILVTGGAGFIGSHLIDAIFEGNLAEEVLVVDNLSSGDVGFIKGWLDSGKARLVRVDLRDLEETEGVIRGVDVVFHFAANPEVRKGSEDPSTMWANNVIATYNVLEAMRKNDVPHIVFASSSTVYGEPEKIPTPEDYGPLEPISTYGASKLAGEAWISAYAHTYGIKGLVLRFANIIGPRLRHGVIYDFIVKLLRNPSELEILGDGTQRKSYLFVGDAVDATLHLLEHQLRTGERVGFYNVGNDDWVTVKEIADIVSKVMGVSPKYNFTGGVEGGRGWKGDVKYMLLDISKLKGTGWSPKYSSNQAVEKTTVSLIKEIVG